MAGQTGKGKSRGKRASVKNQPIRDLEAKGEKVKAGWNAEGMGRGALAAAAVVKNMTSYTLVLGEAKLEEDPPK